jgi:hypothetical protein
VILENSLERHGYARLLIADYHLEYPLEAQSGARVELVWHPFEIGQVIEGLHGHYNEDVVQKFEEEMFGPLEQLYGHDYEAGMNLWLVQGSVGQLTAVAGHHAHALMGGSSGDDDTFDYWPNAFEMLQEMATDVIRLGGLRNYLIYLVDRVVKSAIACNGPAKEWDADFITTAVDELRAVNLT